MPNPRVRANNRLATSPYYGQILREYNERFARDGKVNDKKFFEEVVEPLIPDYGLHGWYAFVKRFKTTAGLIAANAQVVKPPTEVVDLMPQEKTFLTNQQATSIGIQSILNIGAARAKELMENPHLISAKEAVELMLKVMKAQDSRIHAIGKLREDNREQEKFDRAFSGAQF